MPLTVMLALTAIIIAALVLPFFVHAVEKELEIFIFILGVLAVSVSGAWSLRLAEEALLEPVKITLAVLITGILFNKFNKQLVFLVDKIQARIGIKKSVIIIVFLLSFLSSVITAIVAALVLCEAAATLRLSQKDTVHVIVMGCFGIGMGAVLTPIGEPLSTIVVNKLSGPPHHAGFFYLLDMLWPFVVVGVCFFSFLAGRLKEEHKKNYTEIAVESVKAIIVRSAKVYLFIMALVLFGKGLTPLAEATIKKLPSWALYWANTISAVLDNATLAAAEIVPDMTNAQIEFMLMALIISGGLLIPGNIPNIICASKFKIKSKQWAKDAFIPGFALMLVTFILVMLFPAKG